MATALIQERGTVSGNQMRMRRLPEDAAQAFLAGTPVALHTNGCVRALATTGATRVLGIAKDFGANLTTAGAPLGLPANTAFYVPPLGGGVVQAGDVVQFQPLGRRFLRPNFNDGRTGVVLAITDTVFYGQVGPTDAAPTPALVGTEAGLARDTDEHWYVHPAGTTKLVVIVGLDQWDKARGVLFTFKDGIAQLPS
jgi:hypothetical protein